MISAAAAAMPRKRTKRGPPGAIPGVFAFGGGVAWAGLCGGGADLGRDVSTSAFHSISACSNGAIFCACDTGVYSSGGAPAVTLAFWPDGLAGVWFSCGEALSTMQPGEVRSREARG